MNPRIRFACVGQDPKPNRDRITFTAFGKFGPGTGAISLNATVAAIVAREVNSLIVHLRDNNVTGTRDKNTKYALRLSRSIRSDFSRAGENNTLARRLRK